MCFSWHLELQDKVFVTYGKEHKGDSKEAEPTVKDSTQQSPKAVVISSSESSFAGKYINGVSILNNPAQTMFVNLPHTIQITE